MSLVRIGRKRWPRKDRETVGVEATRETATVHGSLVVAVYTFGKLILETESTKQVQQILETGK